jgi:Ca-activated chloride channel homolog
MRKIRSRHPHRFAAMMATLALHSSLVGVVAVSSSGPASAQSAKTGAVRGVVRDRKTGEPLVGVTVVATGPSLPGTLSAITDEKGEYVITELPAGVYTISYFYADATLNATGIRVVANNTVISNQKINLEASKGEVIAIKARVPIIDPTSTNQGVKISKEYLSKLPVAGRSFEGSVLHAPGTRADGLSISGSTSVQNTYVVNGVASPANIAAGPTGPRHDTSNESYDPRNDNPFLRVTDAPMSTFSTDVDTASYSNFRRMVRDQVSPPADSIRLEEWINYFHYDELAKAKPVAGEPIAITTELTQSPWHPKLQMLRIGVRAPDIAPAAIPTRNLVFLIDVSGSMNSPDKLPLLQRGLAMLVEQLRPQDRVSVVVYAGSEGLALPSTLGSERNKIRDAIASLEPGGSTNGAAGITLAYAQAQEHFIKDGINRVILCTDGDFNVGVTSQADLTAMIEEKRNHGVFLTVLGFGTGNLKDSTMEMLADKGNGNYAYIDSINEARKVLVKEAGSTLVTVAKDVKLQLDFNPATVAGYRLVGYENRLLADEDFNDDKKDAGDMGSGHTVTALYEIVPTGVAIPDQKIDASRYRPALGAPTPAAPLHVDELLTVKLRYKEPNRNESKLISRVVGVASVPLQQASIDTRWAVAVASAAMVIRQSRGVGGMTMKDATALARGALGADAEGYRKEFLSLLGEAKIASIPTPDRITVGYGVAVSVTTSLENVYIVDGVNATGTYSSGRNDLTHTNGKLDTIKLSFFGVQPAP